MFERFTEKAIKVVMLSQEEARRLGHNFVGTEQLLLGLIGENGGIANRALRRLGVNLNAARIAVERIVGRGAGFISVEIPFTPRAKRVLEVSIEEARDFGHSYIGTEHMLLAVIEEEIGVAFRVLHELGLHAEDIRHRILVEMGEIDEERFVPEAYADPPEAYADPPDADMDPPDADFEDDDRREMVHPYGDRDDMDVPISIEDFTTNLTDAAEQNKLDPVIGRDDEIERVIQILVRRRKNNPVLIGEPGVGKTAVAEGLSQRIIDGDIPDMLSQKEVVTLDLGLLLAGTKYRGEFEERLKRIMQEVRENKNMILVIDEVHTLIGAGAAEGAVDAANILKPALARGELQCIGATTLDEYRKHIERDPALERRFQPVAVDEPSVIETVEILRCLRDRYETHHHLLYSDEALESAAQMGAQYIADRFLPDKAIDLLDEAGSRVRLKYLRELKLERIRKEEEERRRKEAMGFKDPEDLDKHVDPDEEAARSLARLMMAERSSSRRSLRGERLLIHFKRFSIRRWKFCVKLFPPTQLFRFLPMTEYMYWEKICCRGWVRNFRDINAYITRYSRFRFPCMYEPALNSESEEDIQPKTMVKQELIIIAIRDADAEGKELTTEEREILIKSFLPKVSAQDIATVVSSWTGIPVNKISKSESEKLLSMEDTLHSRIIGQSRAVSAVSRAIRRARVGLRNPNRPIASFLFAGPTGVGKTELTKALASYFFGAEEAMVRLDMSEFMERHTVAKLIGSPPGYVGYNEGGQLTEAVRRKPYTVVLLDEIEKAHPDVYNLLLQIFEDGRLTDSKGRTVDFKHSMLILTSNLGAKIIENNTTVSENMTMGFEKEDHRLDIIDSRYDRMCKSVNVELKRFFRPEFLNRLDEIIIFTRLTRDDLSQIADIMLKQLSDRAAEKGFRLIVTEEAKDVLIDEGYNPSYGARPLRRAIMKLLEDKLANAFLAENVGPGKQVVVNSKDGENLEITIVEDEENDEIESEEPEEFEEYLDLEIEKYLDENVENLDLMIL